MTFVVDNHVSNNYLLTKRSLIVIMAEQKFNRLLESEAKIKPNQKICIILPSELIELEKKFLAGMATFKA